MQNKVEVRRSGCQVGYKAFTFKPVILGYRPGSYLNQQSLIFNYS